MNRTNTEEHSLIDIGESYMFRDVMGGCTIGTVIDVIKCGNQMFAVLSPAYSVGSSDLATTSTYGIYDSGNPIGGKFRINMDGIGSIYDWKYVVPTEKINEKNAPRDSFMR